ncbi:TonB-dependent receptor domain-containing protein [Spongiibacter sp. UBA1325]|uniref:TonB-dependent receptor domain-containing protein n=1 Tax=Spongiibacter sp. UBA1325 TaxID=1947543 RepID=UPI00257BF547|nr:TonB-dependent receptor [Spongiibacter sp. UBA1325]|tara:strand:+ start:10574 stop:13282 length:2709 start_codon:yes stop_codon:yes gene_type:complete
MKKQMIKKGLLPAFSLSALSLAVSAVAQEADSDLSFNKPLEEVVVVGRLKSTAENLVIERLEQEVAVDFLGAEAIGRIGDSTVAAALRRVPGVTLIDDKFVFVRGLGERYSSTLLNGAVVPSPDLTRSVIPLDIFPTSIVESLAVQKVHSSDMPAAFGGGNVDIRTKGIPSDLVFSLEIGTDYNSASDGRLLTYKGGSDDIYGNDDGTRALSYKLKQALRQYGGSLDRNDILADMRQSNPNSTLADAEQLNRELALNLYRNIDIYETDDDDNFSAEVNAGNRFYLGDAEEIEFGVLAGLSYDRSWRNKSSEVRSVSDEDEAEFKNETTQNTSIAANLNFGLRLNEDHSLETTSLYLRNTDDKTSVTDSYDNDQPVGGDISDRQFRIRFEQRELVVNQIRGEHTFGELSREQLGWDQLAFAEGLSFNWFYSDSESTTEIPNEVAVQTRHVEGPNGSTTVAANATAADYRFTDLQDEVESYGWEVKMPFSSMDWKVELSGGNEYWEKARTYRQTQFGLGSVDASDAVRSGPLDRVYSDANILDPNNGYQIQVAGSNSESYIAANRVDAYYGKLDVTWQDTWRVVAGLRYEDYQQVGLTWDPLDFDGIPVVSNESGGQQAIIDELENAVFTDDDTFASLAATYMLPGFWAEDFQLRFGYSETTVRPDLREIADSSYVDPVTGALVFGNPDVRPAQFKNYDLRAEWFFSNSDSFTASLFYKDISDPIELFQAAAGDTNTAVEIVNAESATILGAEVEFMKSLGDFSDALIPFFLQGNLTLLDTELVAGSNADAPTNAKRDLVGASDYAANLILGFDSADEMHAATLSYNVFGERLYFAGRNGEPDAFEQPFHSLDATYSFYPNQSVIVKVKVKNILDEELEIERDGKTTFREEVGTTFSASIEYEF